jgi:SPP1 gp7 family putative phage head morphogenesis protein
VADVVRSIGDQLARAQAAANILGRLTVLRDSSQKTRAPLRFNGSSRLAAFADSSQDQDFGVFTSFKLPPTGAIDYLRNLAPITRDVFDGLSKQYQNDSFTLAGVTDSHVLARVRDQLTSVVAQGGTAADFRRAVASLKSDAGIESVTAAELDNVFQTMTQKAYSAGRYEQMTDDSVMAALPYWQFWTVGDDRVRPEHAVLDQFCALAIDPVWLKIYPPCGWGCRCSVVCLSADEAPEGSDDGGLLRLPVLAIAKVPQPGFRGILAA